MDKKLSEILKDEAKALARYAIKQTIKAQGHKLSSFYAEQITEAASCLLYEQACKALVTRNYETWNGT